MSEPDETCNHCGGPTLRAYVERILADYDRTVQARFTSEERGRKLLAKVLKHRLKVLNGHQERFQKQTSRDHHLFADAPSTGLRLDGLTERVQNVEKAHALIQGRWSVLLLLSGVLAVLVSLALKAILP